MASVLTSITLQRSKERVSCSDSPVNLERAIRSYANHLSVLKCVQLFFCKPLMLSKLVFEAEMQSILHKLFIELKFNLHFSCFRIQIKHLRICHLFIALILIFLRRAFYLYFLAISFLIEHLNLL